MKALPKAYAWLDNVQGMPKMVWEARKLLGTLETPGTDDNPVITAWADEVSASCKTAYAGWAADWYNDDKIPWCGLFMAVVATRSSGGQKARMPNHKYLSALAWADWGVSVMKADAMLGDVLVFIREGGGHVALYIGEDKTHYHILGGNQTDAVNITRIAKSRLYAVRRPAYKQTPAAAKKYTLAAAGAISRNEA